MKFALHTSPRGQKYNFNKRYQSQPS